MSTPDREQLLGLLNQLEQRNGDELESQFLDFKRSQGPKEDLKVACEYACCFANAAGGLLVFGVRPGQGQGTGNPRRSRARPGYLPPGYFQQHSP